MKCSDTQGISYLIIFDKRDAVFDEKGLFVRMKRKYGKRKRIVYKYDYEKKTK